MSETAETIIVYNHAGEGPFVVEREPGEDEKDYCRRVALYDELLGRGAEGFRIESARGARSD
jgi:hypothetical protein